MSVILAIKLVSLKKLIIKKIMKIIKLKNLSKIEYQKLLKRSCENYDPITSTVKKIIDDVKKNGDNSLLKIGKKFYGPNYNSILVTPEEIKEAYKNVDKDFIKAIKQTIKNVTAVHLSQLPSKKWPIVSPETGIKVWREWRPIEKIGLYIPGGKAVYPSSVIMTTIPAKIAGCSNITICSPPQQNGSIPAPTLVAADMVGIKQIYKVGGSEAIAAMTYGTETIDSVYKIFGAGNSYVTIAKILVQETIAIDMPAGPSEVFIIADETSNPSFIAADLLADGEHGEDSSCILITTSEKIAKEVNIEISKQINNLSTKSRAEKSLDKYGFIAIVDSFSEAVEFSNQYAPEHLEIMVKNPESLINKITNAGSVFLGDWTAKSSGDYATGANHILPTSGYAKMYPPLGVDAFGKWMQVQKCTKQGLDKIRKTIETLAEIENLPAHKFSCQIRFKK